MSAGSPPDEPLPPELAGLEDVPPERWIYTVLVEILAPDGTVLQTHDLTITSPDRLSDDEVARIVAEEIAPLLARLCGSPRLLAAMGGECTWRIVGIAETFE